MHKRNRHIKQKPILEKPPIQWGFTPRATKLGLGGFPFILLGLCDAAARLHNQVSIGAVGAMLRLAYGFECIVAGLAILIGGVLLLDFMERRDEE